MVRKAYKRKTCKHAIYKVLIVNDSLVEDERD